MHSNRCVEMHPKKLSNEETAKPVAHKDKFFRKAGACPTKSESMMVEARSLTIHQDQRLSPKKKKARK
jgi:hypothetical protein